MDVMDIVNSLLGGGASQPQQGQGIVAPFPEPPAAPAAPQKQPQKPNYGSMQNTFGDLVAGKDKKPSAGQKQNKPATKKASDGNDLAGKLQKQNKKK